MAPKTEKMQASVLAFERKIAPSDGLMAAGNWQDREKESSWTPVFIEEKSVRGTISNRLKAAIENDPAKMDAEVEKANLQTIDFATLNHECDTLKLSFTLRILGDLATPTTCNNSAYQEKLAKHIHTYIEQNGFTELAKRYALNIANGRFLWRNRMGAEEIHVVVKQWEKQTNTATFTFNAHSLPFTHFDTEDADVLALAKSIENGLRGLSFTFFTIEAFARIGSGQEVFPSQELVMEKSSGKGEKSKVLYQLNKVAAMHSQKIGNALRTIDNWHPHAAEVGPIPVEPYGSVSNRGSAYRAVEKGAEKVDFYNLLDNWMEKDKTPTVEQQHYLMATLIRGGVFGKSDKDK